MFIVKIFLCSFSIAVDLFFLSLFFLKAVFFCSVVCFFVAKLKLNKIINNTIVIPKNLVSGYKILKLRCPFITKNLIKLCDFNSIKNQFKKYEEEVYSYLCETLNYNYFKEFFIYCENDVVIIPKKELKTLIEELEHFENINKNIFRITLFYYQINNEMAYLWKSDLTEEFNDMEYYTQKVITFINKSDFTEQFTFHPTYKHSKLPIVGELDMISNEKIVDIKFSNNLNIKHILQILLYNHLIDPTFEKEYKLVYLIFRSQSEFQHFCTIECNPFCPLLQVLGLAFIT